MNKNTTQITVLFATFNGENVIRKTLEGYTSQITNEVNWEIVIVDNASTDSTYSIIKSYEDKLPLKLLKCAIPGKNAALNSAIPHIEGDFIIVTDDDAVPDINFIQSWQEASSKYPQYSIFGGSVIPRFDFDIPLWMSESSFHFEEIYAQRILQTGDIAATAIFGPNMAIRKQILDDGIHFNEDIGPNGTNKNYPMGSETEFLRRAEAAGNQAYFISESRVDHIVRKNQISVDFWIKRAYKHGLGTGMQKIISSGQYSLIKTFNYGLKGFLGVVKHKIKSLLARNELERNESIWQAEWEKGYAFGRIQTVLKTKFKI